MILFLDNPSNQNRFDYIYPELHFNVGYDEIRFEGVMNALFPGQPDKTPYTSLPPRVIEKALRKLIEESTSASTSKNPYMCDFVQSMVWETVPTFFWANDEKNLEECVRQYKWKIEFSNSLHNVLRKLSIDTEANPSLMERLGKLRSEEKVLSETMMTEGDPESLVVIDSLKKEILEMVLGQENVVSGTFVADLREIAQFVHEQLSIAVNADAIEQGIRSACLEKFSSYDYNADHLTLLQAKEKFEDDCEMQLPYLGLSLFFYVHLLANKIIAANKIVEYIRTTERLRYVKEKLSQSHQDNHESGDRGNSCEAITSTSPEEGTTTVNSYDSDKKVSGTEESSFSNDICKKVIWDWFKKIGAYDENFEIVRIPTLEKGDKIESYDRAEFFGKYLQCCFNGKAANISRFIGRCMKAYFLKEKQPVKANQMDAYIRQRKNKKNKPGEPALSEAFAILLGITANSIATHIPKKGDIENNY